MKKQRDMKKANRESGLSPDLEQLLAQTPVLTKADLRELQEAGEALDEDPQFLAEVIKSTFINEVYVGMEQAGFNKNTLAKKWGRTRQYLGKLLNEDKRVNFTVETMVELVHLLGKRLELHVVGKQEQCSMLRSEAPVARTVGDNPFKGDSDRGILMDESDRFHTSTKIIRGSFHEYRRSAVA